MYSVQEIVTTLFLLSILLVSSSTIYIALIMKEHDSIFSPSSNIDETIAQIKHLKKKYGNSKKYY